MINYLSNETSNKNQQRRIRQDNGAFSYDPAWVEEVKSIEGKSGTLPKNTGVFPYSENVVGKILSIFPGENIHIDAGLQVSIPPKADTLVPIRHSQLLLAQITGFLGST